MIKINKTKLYRFLWRTIKSTGLIDQVYFFKEYREFKLNNDGRFSIDWNNNWPILNEKVGHGFNRDYTYHTSWAARKIKEINPNIHHDIGSDLRFVTLVSAFKPVVYHEYRMIEIHLNNLKIEKTDICKLTMPDNHLESLSCLSVLEHIGLGRYGDKIDPKADLIAISELIRVLAVNGSLLVVVPIADSPNLQFNAHRIYSHSQILDYFSELKLIEFALIPDDKKDGHIIINPSKKLLDQQKFGIGCYWYKK
ncbi:MAG: hypothetical protein CMG74_07540 [Candidatus Marinimicrobia bacterium]|nr:hypothetical protein [Candidatus Neomarinimicrobiota bacterium]|tara:strand:- start:581 stop:1336 length:756 start_codon:yes stop_codon:yes gene_type:complete